MKSEKLDLHRGRTSHSNVLIQNIHNNLFAFFLGLYYNYLSPTYGQQNSTCLTYLTRELFSICDTFKNKYTLCKQL